jgi:hypothetical protein
MAKKLTKAQIAKNPTKAINSGQMKMRKQEVPFGGIGKAAAKAVSKALGKKTVVRKKVVGGAQLSPSSDGMKAKISDNVTVRIKAKPNYEFSKDLARLDTIARSNKKIIKATKSDVRGLKAANKPTKAGKNKNKMINMKPRKMEPVPADVSARFNQTLSRLVKEQAKKKSK